MAASADAASGFTISGKVTSQGSGAGVANTEVVVTESGTSNEVAMPTTTAADGSYAVSVPAGAYDLTFTPPSGSELGSFVDRDEVVSGDRTVNVVLIPAGASVFSGKLLGEGGVPLANATVRVGHEYLTTHADGSFSGSFAPGSYLLEIEGYRQPGISPAAAPYRFHFYGGEIHLSGSVEENLTLPVHALTIRTTGPGGSPIPGVKFIGAPTSTYIGGHGQIAPGLNLTVGYVEEDETTNANGETTLSLPYYESLSNIEAAPPAETQLARTPINIEKVNEDQTRLLAFGKSGTDVTPPEIDCEAPPTGWHAENVTTACTASDSGSGLANPEDASFSLSTSVAPGEEAATAETNSRRVCDKADNCSQAGPLLVVVW